MEILEPLGQRFEAALELLLEGHSFTFDGIHFSLSSDDLLVVSIQSSYWPPQNISEQTALNDLQRAKNIADYLAGESASFAKIIRNRQRRFLLLNYYGHGGGVEWARLVNGRVIWAKGAAHG